MASEALTLKVANDEIKAFVLAEIESLTPILVDGTPEDCRDAELRVERLLHIDPQNAGLVFLMGTCLMRQQRWVSAELWFQVAINRAPDFAEAYNNLGWIYDQTDRRAEAKNYFMKAMELDPQQSEFRNNFATLFVNNGTPQEAIEHCNLALELLPDSPDAHWNRALAYLELAQFEEGFQDYDWGLHSPTSSTQRRKRRHYLAENQHPYWDGTHGQVVAIYGEQGVGDEIMAASMLEEAARDARIIYECHPRLVSIMRHSFDSFPIYGTRKVEWQENHWPHWTPELNAKCPILNLAKIYRKSQSDFPRKPYLKPFDNQVDKYRERLRKLGSRPKIGFSWKGGSLLTRKDLRSLRIEDLLPLFKSIDADWISLQYDPAEQPGWNAPIVSEFCKDSGVTIHHWAEDINDLDYCYGGLIHAVDLVITVNTSLVHACGAYGVPCWTLTPSRPAWRYNVPGVLDVGDDKMIWYGDHVRQIRQQGDDWAGVIDVVKNDLESWMEEVTAA